MIVSFLMWLVGFLLMCFGMGLLRIVDTVTRADGSVDRLACKITYWSGFVMIVLGALLWRYA